MSVLIQPWQVWWVDLEPVAGREQGRDRPAIVVSSAFHLRLVRGQLLSVLPLTTVERAGWLHRVRITLPGRGSSWVITEQLRTLSATRLTGAEPIGRLTVDQIAQVRAVLAKMIDV
ncbi:MAG TPA: type II toxin-antitoxin system PemK/MazF family toxin [Pseudonocardiaceae bacterium]|nr:type II toxin-antitoxin system PemK/MazF family toxin [Pseudonocardiaceae bacterium]